MKTLHQAFPLEPVKEKAVHRAMKRYAKSLGLTPDINLPKPQEEPVIKSIRKVRRDADRLHRATVQYKIELLLDLQTKWKRKLTIAQNKLNWVRSRLDEQAIELAKKLDGGKP